jgi:hypothetical protein
MKAKEAPEKLYLLSNGLISYCRNTDEDVEYTSTDAFIEKAEKFFTEKFEVEDYNDNIDIDGSPIFNYGRFIDDFKKYMKGE